MQTQLKQPRSDPTCIHTYLVLYQGMTLIPGSITMSRQDSLSCIPVSLPDGRSLLSPCLWSPVSAPLLISCLLSFWCTLEVKLRSLDMLSKRFTKRELCFSIELHPQHVSHVKHGTYMKSYRMSLVETGFFTHHKPLETRYPVYLMPFSSMSTVCVDHHPGFDLG